MTAQEAIRQAQQDNFVPVAKFGKPPKEWWGCPASNLKNEMKDAAACCYVGLCGTDYCPLRLTSKPPDDWVRQRELSVSHSASALTTPSPLHVSLEEVE